MNNRYNNTDCGCYKPGSLFVEINIESKNGNHQNEMEFILRFYVYGNPEIISIHKNHLFYSNGKYYAVLNENHFANGWLLCNVDILPKEDKIKECESICINTGILIGGCNHGCNQNVGQLDSGRYIITINRVDTIPGIPNNHPLSNRVSISENRTWIVDGVDTGFASSPLLKNVNNKLYYSYDNLNWEPCSEEIAHWFRINENKLQISSDKQNWKTISDSIAAYFRFVVTESESQGGTIGKIQISRDNKEWSDLSPVFTNNLRIKDYVSLISELPLNAPAGTVYGVGPTYSEDDTIHINPIYTLYVWNGTKWINNGRFTSIAAGVVQGTGNSETEVMSQKAVTEEIENLGTESLLDDVFDFWGDTTIESTDGYVSDSILRSNGEIAAFSGFAVSPYLEVLNTKSYYLYGLDLGSTYAAVIIYDKNKSIIRTVIGSDIVNKRKYHLQLPPAAKYIRCSYYPNTPEYYIYSKERKESYSEFDQFTNWSVSKASIPLSNIELIETEYSDGIFGNATGGSYVTSDYINIGNESVYIYLMDTFASTYKLIEFYDKNKNVVTTIYGGNSMFLKAILELTPPINAKYIRYARGVYQTSYGLFRAKGTGFVEMVKEVTKQDDNIYNDRPFTQLPYPIDTDLVAIEATFEDGIFGSLNEGFYTTDFIEIDLSDGKNYYWKNTQNFDNIYNKLVYYDKNKNVISVVGGNQGFSNTIVILTPPFNAKYLKYATYKKVNEIYKGAPIDFRAAVKKITNESFTESANVLWLGTSIPEGATYPKVSCESNGYSCINMAYGASYLRWTGSFPTVNEYSGRSLTATVDELESAFRQSVTDGVISESLLERWKNMSYQRSVIPYIDGTNSKQVSMIVIDHGFNDRENIASMLENESSINWDSRDRSNFVGAFNYLVDEIQRINPFIKIVVGGYFQNHYAPYYSEQICKMQELIAEHFGFELLPVWKYSQINDKNVVGTSTYISEFNAKYGTSYTKMGADSDGNIISFQLYCPDKVHPHSDLTGNCNKRLNAIYTKLIRNCI